MSSDPGPRLRAQQQLLIEIRDYGLQMGQFHHLHERIQSGIDELSALLRASASAPLPEKDDEDSLTRGETPGSPIVSSPPQPATGLSVNAFRRELLDKMEVYRLTKSPGVKQDCLNAIADIYREAITPDPPEQLCKCVHALGHRSYCSCKCHRTVVCDTETGINYAVMGLRSGGIDLALVNNDGILARWVSDDLFTRNFKPVGASASAVSPRQREEFKHYRPPTDPPTDDDV